ncbi:CRISPR-associated helicase Cas3' [Aquamicrobium sp. NLF2-7]|uniref:CRISPR-associated helicase Cas3' n=1 Tax=Aquamicrobium sp. NLF2-7 TaxID=2918753 RepID=UPI001EFA7675|nr:CRISPR-associated helicase Cas3' [Aquamicrobium sp. NLF2-7]MCG8269941.1 CRISPR-associated helicase Cas3' [Aquamicrobium sp. NLF2-7]
MTGKYYAHSGTKADRSDWQLLEDHHEACARLAKERATPLGLGAAAELAARFHDFGKYTPDFDRVLRGEKVEVTHSTAGARLLLDRVPKQMRLVAEALAYTILGHHAGLPDRRNASAACFEHRIKNDRDRISKDIIEAQRPDFEPAARELMARMRPAHVGFDFSVAIRMIFSCLVDADFRDTEGFYDKIENRQHDRAWPAFADILPDLTAAFDAHIASFSGEGRLNRLRREILSHVRAEAALAPGLFTLTVPTGGGKTLASMGFALDHAARHGHRRIIYAIPYTSIIEQTAGIFRRIFDDVVLEHHASIDEEKYGSEQRDRLRLAMEDWAAPIVVTTNVQLFESLFAARPSRCRKLHNITGSIIILDEAQCLPRKLLLPALRMLDTLATHYGCTIIFCTATQPAFDSKQLREWGLSLADRELAPDPAGLARELRRANIRRGGEMDDAALIDAMRGESQGLVIVNSRKHALALYQAARAEELEGIVHLTTRQYPTHRRRILDEVRRRLESREACRLIATSLIEAGVDVDFPVGWRAEAGLDSCVQAAGRINRENKRPVDKSTLTLFSAPEHKPQREIETLAEAMRSTAKNYDDLLSPEAIRDWFEEVYFKQSDERLGKKMVTDFLFTLGGTDFPFRRIADEFRMIETAMVPVIVAVEENAQHEIRRLSVPEISSGTLARALQGYTVQIPEKDRTLLIANGHASFHAKAQRGDQFCVLDNNRLYREDVGLMWEDAPYLGIELGII